MIYVVTIETYCSACDSWSPANDWEDGDVWDGDVHLEAYVVCPLCGHHFPWLDPPNRQVSEGCVCDTRNGQMGCEVHRTGIYANTNEGETVTDKKPNSVRWQAFSDEELSDLRAGCEERWEKRALPEELRRRAANLSGEIYRELQRRRGRYRGPGVYRGNVSAEGEIQPEYEVYGVVSPGADRMLVVRADSESDELVMVSLRSFERLMSSNQPSYEWVRPLPGREGR